MLWKGCFDSLYACERCENEVKGPSPHENKGNSQNPGVIAISYDRGAILRASMAIAQTALAYSDNG